MGALTTLRRGDAEAAHVQARSVTKASAEEVDVLPLHGLLPLSPELGSGMRMSVEWAAVQFASGCCRGAKCFRRLRILNHHLRSCISQVAARGL